MFYKKKLSPIAGLFGVVIFAGLVGGVRQAEDAFGADVNWTGAVNNNWYQPLPYGYDNWDADPTGAGIVKIGITGVPLATVDLNGSDSVGVLQLGVNSSSSTLNIGPASALTCTTLLVVSEYSGTDINVGVVNQTGGSVIGPVLIGHNKNAASGTYNLSGGSLIGNVTISTHGHGYLNISGTATVNPSSLIIGEGYQSGRDSIVTQSGGTVTIGSGGITLGVRANGNGVYNLHGGTLSTPLIKKGDGTATFVFDGGTLDADSIQISLTNSATDPYYGGTLSPGGAGTIGTTTFTDSNYYTIAADAAAAVLAIDLDADTNTADLLDVGGMLTLDGTLDVSLMAGTLEIGDTFDILDWGTLVGTFDTLHLPPSVDWDTSKLYTTGEITAIPEPSTLVLVALGGLGLLLLVLRRKRR